MRLSRLVLIGCLAACLVLTTSVRAHVNSPHAYKEGVVAGRRVVAVVHAPRAVPGEAEAQLRILDLQPGETPEVSFREIPPEGDAHAPAWDSATKSVTDPAFFTAPMPLMVFGLFEAEFRVRIAGEEGSIRVPLTARNPVPLSMPMKTRVTLIAATLFLLVTGIGVARVVAAEATRSVPGAASTAARRRGLAAAALFAAGFLGFVAFSLFTWRAMHRRFELSIGAPVAPEWIVRNGTPRAGKLLDAWVTLTGTDGKPMEGLMEEAGSALHVTAVGGASLTSLVHVHGAAIAPGTFAVAWRPSEIGRHSVFVDFGSRATGWITEVQELIVSPAMEPSEPFLPGGPDVQAQTFVPLGDARGQEALQRLGDDASLLWENRPPAPFAAGEVAVLEFRLQGAAAAALDAARAEMLVLRENLQLYDRVLAAPAAGGTDATGVARFAHGFPSPGRYRLVLLIPDGTCCRGAAFDIDVR